ncbi:MAG: zf-TFIIB domain-containing protein [Myxococcales bacterium]|nr:zf-TFIIB domain-containing protein [Myxococcales bacterium]
MRDERSPYLCPRCGDRAWVGRGPDVVLHACAQCRGIWLDARDAARVGAGLLDERSTKLAARVDAGKRDGAGQGYRQAGDAGLRRCPHCGKGLTTSTAAGELAIDVCEEHGVYFDADELRAIAEDARTHRHERAIAAEARLQGLADAVRRTLHGE